jgi:hypothetical protein
MKEDQLINQLKYFKKLEPRPGEMISMENRILNDIGREEVTRVSGFSKAFSRLREFFRVYPVSYGFTLAFAVFVIVTFTTISPFRNTIKFAWVSTRIVLASNIYQKASLAFAYSQNQLGDLPVAPNHDTVSKIKDLADSANVANSYLAGLHLVGEPGKYTNDQCLELYRKYVIFLEKFQANVLNDMKNSKDNTSKSELQNIYNRITLFDKQADLRLKSY